MPPKLLTLVAGAVTAFAVACFAVVGTQHVELLCQRGADGAGVCQVVSSSFLLGERRFPRSIGEVREQQRVNTGKANAPRRWTVALLDRSGAQIEFGTYESEADAAVLGNRVRRFLGDPAAAPFRVEESRGVGPYVFLAIAVGAAIWTVQRLRRTTPVESTPRDGRAPGASSTSLPSYRVFLVGLVLLVAFAAGSQVLLTRHADRTQGWLEFQVESRCTFGGLEMLPGAASRQSIDPGHYCARVFNPDVAGHWETQCFDVAIGRTTVVRCRAGDREVPRPE